VIERREKRWPQSHHQCNLTERGKTVATSGIANEGEEERKKKRAAELIWIGVKEEKRRNKDSQKKQGEMQALMEGRRGKGGRDCIPPSNRRGKKKRGPCSQKLSFLMEKEEGRRDVIYA